MLLERYEQGLSFALSAHAVVGNILPLVIKQFSERRSCEMSSMLDHNTSNQSLQYLNSYRRLLIVTCGGYMIDLVLFYILR
uniref:Uncharacterized protein n=1 Tax=Arundo donax TaxID=35708 RepID=A0A0A9CQY7_ARUDO